MTDADLPQGQIRSGPPRWILVGFGCMGVLGFLIVILAGWTMSYMGRLGNTSEAWKQLAEIVPYDDAARGTPTGVADDPNTAVDESRTPREFRMLMGGELAPRGAESCTCLVRSCWKNPAPSGPAALGRAPARTLAGP